MSIAHRAVMPVRSCTHPLPGGRTIFPQLGLKFAPAVGAALVWYNLDRHGVLDERTLHAGEPVGAGEKWGMNIWLREKPRPSKECRCSIRIELARASGTARVVLTIALSRRAELLGACGGCGDVVGPIGLCLCKSKYCS